MTSEQIEAEAHRIAVKVATSGKTGRVHQMAYDAAISGARLALELASSRGSAVEVKAAANDVLAERKRQIEAEGWTEDHDNGHTKGELLRAAKSYFANAIGKITTWSSGVPHDWPWEAKWWKPKTPRQDLVRAGALALAEFERVKRASSEAKYRILDAEVYYRAIISEIERLDRIAPETSPPTPVVTQSFQLEWLAGARPPAHPLPMTGRQSFDTFENALQFFNRQASDAQFVSLTEHITAVLTVSHTAKFEAAPASREGR